MWQITLDPLSNLPICQEVESSLSNFLETCLLLFWDLFGYGEVQKTAIFLPNLRYAKNTSDDDDVYLGNVTQMA